MAATSMTAFYNEIDPFAAATLRELIKHGHIAPGVVDERSIEDINPYELLRFTQCHFFAGIGVWSYALRSAGWPDDRPVWTGSCPCQPFSAAGQGAGFDDERHLWPSFHRLIRECRPPVVFGEQVASKNADPWIDLVCADLEALGYAFGAVPFPAASVGAPHIRDRLYWVADAGSARAGRNAGAASGEETGLRGARHTDGRDGGHSPIPGGAVCGLANPRFGQRDGIAVFRGIERNRQDARWPQGGSQPEPCGDHGGVADTESRGAAAGQQPGQLRRSERGSDSLVEGPPAAGPVNGHWRAADWLLCRDGRWRPVEPSTQPLAHGAPARVGRLRGYGNAIVAQQAQAFIEAYLDARGRTVVIEDTQPW